MSRPPLLSLIRFHFTLYEVTCHFLRVDSHFPWQMATSLTSTHLIRGGLPLPPRQFTSFRGSLTHPSRRFTSLVVTCHLCRCFVCQLTSFAATCGNLRQLATSATATHITHGNQPLVPQFRVPIRTIGGNLPLLSRYLTQLATSFAV
jgi:hypothetical protein